MFIPEPLDANGKEEYFVCDKSYQYQSNDIVYQDVRTHHIQNETLQEVPSY